MTTRLLVGGVPLLAAGSELVVPGPHELVDWTHSWDAEDAATYFGGADAMWPAATDQTRVRYIEDRGHATTKRPLYRDLGHIGETIDSYTTPPNPGHPALPGCKWIRSSDRFNGRACWRADLMEDLPPGAFANHVFSALSIDQIPVGSSWDTSMSLNPTAGLTVPYCEAVLFRADTDVSGASTGAKDTGQGHIGDGPTIGIGATSTIAFFQQGGGYPTITINHSTGTGNTKNETALLIVSAQGPADSTNSFVDWTWKDANGVVKNTRQQMDPWGANGIPPYRDPFSGIVHTSYVSW